MPSIAKHNMDAPQQTQGNGAITVEDIKRMDKARSSPAGKPPKRFIKRYRTEVASSISSICSTTAGFPLDSVKTRMQTYKYNNFVDCVRQTYKVEGLAGFFRGVIAPLSSVTVVRTVSFSTYQKAKYFYSDIINKNFGSDPMASVNAPGNYPSLATIVCFAAAGATAGSFISVLACPFELTKLSAQVSVLMANKVRLSDTSATPSLPAGSTSIVHKGTFQTSKEIIKNRGFLGLYSGFNLHLLRDTLGTALYFCTYETIKQSILTYTNSDRTTSPLSTVIAGGLCGTASWALIYPIDSAKSIYQRNCLAHRAGDAPPRMPKIEFFNRRLYRGLGVSMGRSAFINAVFFSVFETLKKSINEMDDY